jgi:hypothetical protein
MTTDHVDDFIELGGEAFFAQTSWGTVLERQRKGDELLLTAQNPELNGLSGLTHPDRLVHVPGLKPRLRDWSKEFSDDETSSRYKLVTSLPAIPYADPVMDSEDIESQGMTKEDEWINYLIRQVPSNLNKSLVQLPPPFLTDSLSPFVFPDKPIPILPSTVCLAPKPLELPPPPVVKRRRPQRKVPNNKRNEKYWAYRKENTEKAKKSRDKKKAEKKAKTLLLVELAARQKELRAAWTNLAQSCKTIQGKVDKHLIH